MKTAEYVLAVVCVLVGLSLAAPAAAQTGGFEGGSLMSADPAVVGPVQVVGGAGTNQTAGPPEGGESGPTVDPDGDEVKGWLERLIREILLKIMWNR